MVTKRTILATALTAAAVAVAGCDRAAEAPADIAGPAVRVAPPVAPAADRRSERLALRMARAMHSPVFRAYVRAQLEHSPFREGKLPFQAFLDANGGRGRAALARENDETEDAVAADAAQAIALEFYLPVPAHRTAWAGDEDILVATALRDGEAPVAFDTRGRRTLLDAATPPVTPVLALVPVETDFTRPMDGLQACLDDSCSGGGGGGGGDDGSGGDGGGGTVATGSLYMTAAHFGSTYESWIKGSPEFEVHILGQVGQSDSLMSYQCAGEHAGGPYAYDQNGKDWTGSVLLFSRSQFDQYRTAHPGQSVRVFFLEDDDTACQIKVDQDRFAALIAAADQAYGALTSGRDTTIAILREFRRARSGQNLLSALASWIRTNDDPVGTAVEDAVVGTYYAGFNWIVKGDNNVTNGWVNLEMR